MICPGRTQRPGHAVTLPTDRVDCAAFSPARVHGAICESPRDCRREELLERPSRETMAGVCSAGNPKSHDPLLARLISQLEKWPHPKPGAVTFCRAVYDFQLRGIR